MNLVAEPIAVEPRSESHSSSIPTPWPLILSISLLFSLAFFVRHIAGYVVSGHEYTPFVYDASEVRAPAHSKYDFRPDDSVWDETRAYARMTQGVLRGEWLNATIDTYQPYIAGGQLPKRKWFIRDGIGQVVLAGIASLPNSSVPFAFILADLIFVFASSVMLMRLCFALRPSGWFAVTGSAFVLFLNWRDFLNELQFFRGAPQNSSMFLRTPYPQIAFPILLLAMLALVRFLEKRTFARAAILSVALALNSYTYFYSWTFAYALIAAAGILLFAEEQGWLSISFSGLDKRQIRRYLAGLAAAMAIGLMASLPVWLGVLQKTSAVTDSFRRINGLLTHSPDLRDSVPLVLLLLAIIIWKAKGLHVHWLTPAILLASLIVLNIQVLTGKTIQQGHWSAYFIRPLIQLCALDALWVFIEGRKQLRNAIAWSIVALGILSTVFQFWTAARTSVQTQTREPSFDQLVTKMRQPQLAKYGFVTNDVYLSTILPAHVPEKPLLPSYMDPISDVELSQLQLAAAEATGYSNWQDYSAATGVAAKPDETVKRLHFQPDKVLVVANKHRAIARSATEQKCPVLENQDYLLLAPCDAK